jgi:ribosomal subunit interface protein
MTIPTQITYRGFDSSEALEERILKKVARLERLQNRITSCHVTLDRIAARHHQGKIFEVHVHLALPGARVEVTRESGLDHGHEDVYVAVRDAFARAERQLEELIRVHREDVKTHVASPHGRVVRMFAEQGYGFLESSDLLEVYFHRNAVADGSFDALEVDDEVRFVLAPDPGENGPQASTVTRIGKHHVVDRAGTIPTP